MNKLIYSEINWESFNRLSVIQRYCLLVFTLTLCVGFGYWPILRSDVYQYNSLLTEENNLRIEFEEKQEKANVLAYQKQFISLEKVYKEKLKVVTKKDEIYNLLNDISKAGTESGLVMELFAPRLAESKNFLNEITVNMVMIGEYQQLSIFLSRILQFNRLIQFCDFDLRKLANNEQKNSAKIESYSLLRMTMRAKIYQYKNNNYDE
ncbi:type 4a pilus biogenesis protein PilO [Legionella drozanskii]|uniref:Tfp pilus assembly protein PilO n=1 Tax=Legionella drozanskii LLAP-1 TaxID=1212489 RepID=A0A0W0SQM6_9GAMM|nr:type 4a pilus biogenesis protein PilO [Legionella drozanskii]KTC85664.1 Tfp pilus assembly protein PilO [Legionella drozanskii LLAP-1]